LLPDILLEINNLFRRWLSGRAAGLIALVPSQAHQRRIFAAAEWAGEKP